MLDLNNKICFLYFTFAVEFSVGTYPYKWQIICPFEMP